MEPDMEDGFAIDLGVSGESPEGAGFPGMGDPGKDTAGFRGGDDRDWMSEVLNDFKKGQKER